MLDAMLEWANFLVRWIHVIAGISWIGNSFYFMWMDSSFEKLAEPRAGVDGELYMVHGGHFYHVEKQKIRPGFLPKTLHWFKWEATFTWLSGFVLMILLYYFTGGVYLVGPGMPIADPKIAVLVSLGFIFGTWFIYDFFWQSNFAERHKNWATAISFLAAIALSWALCRLFTGRGAFLHLGAVFATLMVLNVWVRILPRQQAMLDTAKGGNIPNYDAGVRAKARSTHNSYLTLPVLFTMLSNHFPLAYGQSHNWVVLVFICVFGGLVRHMMLEWNYGRTGAKLLIPISLVLALLFFLTAPRPTILSSKAGRPAFSEVRAIVGQRCLSCHSAHPTDEIFTVAPNGVVFDDPMVLQKFAARIRERVVVLKTMPLANRSQMTDAEREVLARWVDSGAEIHD